MCELLGELGINGDTWRTRENTGSPPPQLWKKGHRQCAQRDKEQPSEQWGEMAFDLCVYNGAASPWLRAQVCHLCRCPLLPREGYCTSGVAHRLQLHPAEGRAAGCWLALSAVLTAGSMSLTLRRSLDLTPAAWGELCMLRLASLVPRLALCQVQIHGTLAPQKGKPPAQGAKEITALTRCQPLPYGP